MTPAAQAAQAAQNAEQPAGTPKALLLDLGGVVLHVDPRRCLAHWAAAAGVDAERLAERWHADACYAALEVDAIDFAAYTRSLSTQLGIALPADEWRAGWNALLGDPIAEVVRLLPEVAARIPLYCFSNTNRVHQATWEQRLGTLLAPFREVYVSWKLGLRKPDARAYRRVAAAMGYAPGDIAFLDDSSANVEGARQAGMTAWHVPEPSDTLRILERLSLATPDQALAMPQP